MVRGGCKRSFGPSERRASCTGATPFGSGAKEGLGGAKDSWVTFAPWAQKTFCALSYPLLGIFSFQVENFLTWETGRKRENSKSAPESARGSALQNLGALRLLTEVFVKENNKNSTFASTLRSTLIQESTPASTLGSTLLFSRFRPVSQVRKFSTRKENIPKSG